MVSSIIIWTAKKVSQMRAKGEITFENPMQRGFVWDPLRRSRLIHSMLEDYPIPAIFVERGTSALYDVLDGKQRLSTIINYMNDMCMLRIEKPVTMDDGSLYNVSKKKFSQLPKELQDRICEYNLNVHYIEDATDEQKKEMFIRLNNGKQMTNIELTKAQTKSAGEVVELAGHAVFGKLMNDSAKDKSADIGFVMQSYAILFNENKCLLNTKIRETMKSTTISAAQVSVISELYDMYVDIFDRLETNKSANSTVIARLKRKSHFIALLPTVQFAHDNGESIETVVEWAKMFFTSPYGSSVNVSYNQMQKGDTNRDPSVRARYTAVLDSFTRYIAGETQQIDTAQVVENESLQLEL